MITKEDKRLPSTSSRVSDWKTERVLEKPLPSRKAAIDLRRTSLPSPLRDASPTSVPSKWRVSEDRFFLSFFSFRLALLSSTAATALLAASMIWRGTKGIDEADGFARLFGSDEQSIADVFSRVYEDVLIWGRSPSNARPGSTVPFAVDRKLLERAESVEMVRISIGLMDLNPISLWVEGPYFSFWVGHRAQAPPPRVGPRSMTNEVNGSKIRIRIRNNWPLELYYFCALTNKTWNVFRKLKV